MKSERTIFSILTGLAILALAAPASAQKFNESAGNITNSTTCNQASSTGGGCVFIDAKELGTGTVTIVEGATAWTSGTITFQVSNDFISWFDVQGTAPEAVVLVTNTTAVGGFGSFNIAGWKWFRAAASGTWAGTPRVIVAGAATGGGGGGSSGGGGGGTGDFTNAVYNASFGTAGTPDTQVRTVQGAAGMTALQVANAGTFAVQAGQTGTWTVQPGNTANTTAWLVTGTGGVFPASQSGTWNITNISGAISLPTGASTAANQTTLITNSGNAATSLAILDDWDETDRAKVNLIVGQAGIAAGAGATGANVPRVDVANDGVVANSLNTIEGNTLTAAEKLTSIDSRLINAADYNQAAKTQGDQVMFYASTTTPTATTEGFAQRPWVDLNGRVQTNVSQINGVAPSMGNGASGTGVPRVTLANDSTGVVGLMVGGSAVAATNPIPVVTPGTLVSGVISTAMTGTTSTSLVSGTASNFLYITSCVVSNGSTTVSTDILLQDGSGGTTLAVLPAPAATVATTGGGGATHTFGAGLKVPTSGNALFAANVTTGSSTKISCNGFRSTVSY